MISPASTLGLLVEPVSYANAFAATCSGSNINQDAGSSISLHDHNGDKTLQLRSTPAPEQATETIHFTSRHKDTLLSFISKKSLRMVKVWVEESCCIPRGFIRLKDLTFSAHLIHRPRHKAGTTECLKLQFSGQDKQYPQVYNFCWAIYMLDLRKCFKRLWLLISHYTLIMLDTVHSLRYV
jgi:hypothetical protein